MKAKKLFNRLLSIVLAIALAVPLTAQNAYATSASHSLGNGAGGADFCTVLIY